jgi:TRAP transporter 4TM/12TM fusion protein
MSDQRSSGLLLWQDRVAHVAAIGFVLLILIYAASAPLSEFVRWYIETTVTGFEELSRRDQRLLLREHWLGALHRDFERTFMLPTGLLLGLPILFSFVISLLSLPGSRRFHAVLALLSLICFSAWVLKTFATDGGALPTANPIDFFVFPLATAITLYLTWRLFGGFITLFCILWIVYFFTRGVLPDWTGVLVGSESSAAQNLRSMVQNFWAQTGGMFGQPLQVVSGNVLIFIVFGAVMMASGAGTLLMKIANRVAGGLVGGAAHGAVASSALFGTLSGAAISNVVSTGVMTIPLIKKAGFKSHFAGAVEAAASTGGQIMPPVMGVVAFFVAGQIGLEYRYIVIAAILPAVFYYYGTFLSVYFEARRDGIGALSAAERPALTGAEKMQCLVFIIPLVVMTYFLFSQPSVPKAGFYGFVAAFVSAFVIFPAFRSFDQISRAFANAGRMAAHIVVIVTAIGLIVGLIQVSGFAGRLAQLLTQLASGPLPLVLIVVALGSIVLGMGLPPGATYFIIVIALSSGIETVGIPALTLHMFVVFFAVMSTVTPPVALAAFAAAPIAGASPMRTGFSAARVGLAGFLIPFVFVYHPAVLFKLQTVFVWFGEEAPNNRALIDAASISWLSFFWVLAAFALGMWMLASALAGFDRRRLPVLERILRAGLGVAVLVPNVAVAGAAVVASAGILFWDYTKGKFSQPSLLPTIRTEIK